MVLTWLTLALALAATALPLLRLEYPALVGTVVASGANERWSVKLLVPALVIAALAGLMMDVLPGTSLLDWGMDLDLHAVVAISLGAAAAVIVAAAITIILYVLGQNLADASDPRTHM